ncbi:MAG: hypothetical protein IK101_08765 [Oscillospiraceae bacterium]|nr:hypothetical protein [Oscillospiraceae bacterium]
MAKEHLLFDKTELMAVVKMGNNYAMRNLKYSDIISISLKPCEKKGIFKSSPSECIELKLKNSNMPLVYFKHEEEKFWDGYKEKIVKFAKDNRITLVDELNGEHSAQ